MWNKDVKDQACVPREISLENPRSKRSEDMQMNSCLAGGYSIPRPEF